MERLTKKFRLVALTNSTAEVAEAQLRNAGLRDLLEVAYSADTVRKLKPAPEPYRMVAERSGVPIGELPLIAPHGWDIERALAAGRRAGFRPRPRPALYPHRPHPPRL